MSLCRRWTMHLTVAHCSRWPNICPASWEASVWGQQVLFGFVKMEVTTVQSSLSETDQEYNQSLISVPKGQQPGSLWINPVEFSRIKSNAYQAVSTCETFSSAFHVYSLILSQQQYYEVGTIIFNPLLIAANIVSQRLSNCTKDDTHNNRTETWTYVLSCLQQADEKQEIA